MTSKGRRALTLWLALGTTIGCSGRLEPSPDPFVDRWLLVTINGQALPAAGESPFLLNPIHAGRLQIFEQGFPRWEYCQERGSDGGLTFVDEDVRYFTGDEVDDRAEISFNFPLSSPVDTLVMEGDHLTWEYNARSGPGEAIDLARFRRLADGEAEGPVCAL